MSFWGGLAVVVVVSFLCCVVGVVAWILYLLLWFTFNSVVMSLFK